MKRLLTMMMAAVLAIGILVPTAVLAEDPVINEKLGVPIVVYGADLSDAEKESVKISLGCCKGSGS